jgi:glycosyltransferase involved in cell wall biosynthesis
VTEGVNGYLFDPETPAQDWADRISAVVRDPSAYAKLCRSSYEKYRKRLNWFTSGQTVKRLLQEMLAQS